MPISKAVRPGAAFVEGVDDPRNAVDWESLTGQAAQIRERAHAPYSGFRVGAAGLVRQEGVAGDRTVLGCNVENASYGLSLCAECGLVSDLCGTGGGQLVAVVVVGPDDAVLPPCGRCRQLLWEMGGPDLLVATASGPRRLAELLSDPFSADDLPAP